MIHGQVIDTERFKDKETNPKMKFLSVYGGKPSSDSDADEMIRMRPPKFKNDTE